MRTPQYTPHIHILGDGVGVGGGNDIETGGGGCSGWNEISDDGSDEWRFEAGDPSAIHPLDSRFFWTGRWGGPHPPHWQTRSFHIFPNLRSGVRNSIREFGTGPIF